MRRNVVSGVLLGTAAMLFSVFFAVPAHAEAPEETGAGGNAAEHRNDADVHARGTSEPAQAASATSDEAAPANEPQPTSNADSSGNGANGHGAYASTRDGSASKNGSGDGAAIGTPCAGCAGKADNKDPRGQFRDGADANNGYECDGNSGIAKTNPAHTGCVLASAPNVPTVPSPAAETPGVTFPAPAPAVAPSVPTVPSPASETLGVTFSAPAPGIVRSVLSDEASASRGAPALAATGSPSGLIEAPRGAAALAAMGSPSGLIEAPRGAAALAATGLPLGLMPLADFGLVLVIAGALFRRSAARRAVWAR